MKRIFIVLVSLLGLQNCAELPKNFKYGVENGAVFHSHLIQLIQSEYKKQYPSVDLTLLNFYTLSHEDINTKVCTGFSGNVGGCVSTGFNLVFLSVDYVQSEAQICTILAHEMLHEILAETENDPDVDHSNPQWDTVDRDFCRSILDK